MTCKTPVRAQSVYVISRHKYLIFGGTVSNKTCMMAIKRVYGYDQWDIIAIRDMCKECISAVRTLYQQSGVYVSNKEFVSAVRSVCQQ